MFDFLKCRRRQENVQEDIHETAVREIARLRKIVSERYDEGCLMEELATTKEGRELIGWLPLERKRYSDRIRVKLTERSRLELDKVGGVSGEILRRFADSEFWCDSDGRGDWYWVQPVGEEIGIKTSGVFLPHVFERLPDEQRSPATPDARGRTIEVTDEQLGQSSP